MSFQFEETRTFETYKVSFAGQYIGYVRMTSPRFGNASSRWVAMPSRLVRHSGEYKISTIRPDLDGFSSIIEAAQKLLAIHGK